MVKITKDLKNLEKIVDVRTLKPGTLFKYPHDPFGDATVYLTLGWLGKTTHFTDFTKLWVISEVEFEPANLNVIVLPDESSVTLNQFQK